MESVAQHLAALQVRGCFDESVWRENFGGRKFVRDEVAGWLDREFKNRGGVGFILPMGVGDVPFERVKEEFRATVQEREGVVYDFVVVEGNMCGINTAC